MSLFHLTRQNILHNNHDETLGQLCTRFLHLFCSHEEKGVQSARPASYIDIRSFLLGTGSKCSEKNTQPEQMYLLIHQITINVAESLASRMRRAATLVARSRYLVDSVVEELFACQPVPTEQPTTDDICFSTAEEFLFVL